ncbi:hypothetical protein BBJ28_00016734, partial [Nothophytophthora sp. Chile5]
FECLRFGVGLEVLEYTEVFFVKRKLMLRRNKKRKRVDASTEEDTEFDASIDLIDDTLSSIQLLMNRNADGFAETGLPPLVLWHQLTLKRTKYKEMHEQQLQKAKLKHSHFQMEFHLADMEGCGLIRRTKVTSGVLVALTNK